MNTWFVFLGFVFPHPVNLILFFWRFFVVKPPKWRVRLQKGVLLVSGTHVLFSLFDEHLVVETVFWGEFKVVLCLYQNWHVIKSVGILNLHNITWLFLTVLLQAEEVVGVHLSTIPRLPATGMSSCSSIWHDFKGRECLMVSTELKMECLQTCTRNTYWVHDMLMCSSLWQDSI